MIDIHTRKYEDFSIDINADADSKSSTNVKARPLSKKALARRVSDVERTQKRLEEFREQSLCEDTILSRIVLLERKLGRPLKLSDLYDNGFNSSEIESVSYALHWLLDGDDPISVSVAYDQSTVEDGNGSERGAGSNSELYDIIRHV